MLGRPLTPLSFAGARRRGRRRGLLVGGLVGAGVGAAAGSAVAHSNDKAQAEAGAQEAQAEAAANQAAATAAAEKNQQAAAGSDSKVMKELQQLGELHDSGVLTDEEFASKKAELLKEM